MSCYSRAMQSQIFILLTGIQLTLGVPLQERCNPNTIANGCLCKEQWYDPALDECNKCVDACKLGFADDWCQDTCPAYISQEQSVEPVLSSSNRALLTTVVVLFCVIIIIVASFILVVVFILRKWKAELKSNTCKPIQDTGDMVQDTGDMAQDTGDMAQDRQQLVSQEGLGPDE